MTLQVPKPEPCEHQEGVPTDYVCALDKLGNLDKIYKDKTFGFYGKSFRSTHANGIFSNIEKPTQLDIQMHVLILLNKILYRPTVNCILRSQLRKSTSIRRPLPVVVMITARRWRMMNETVSTAQKDEYAYDDLVSDTIELFLSGEKMARNLESLGSSSKALVTLFGNLGDWRRGENWLVPTLVDYDKLYYKENHPGTYPDHAPENNNLFRQVVKNLRAHIILVCEAGTLVPYRG